MKEVSPCSSVSSIKAYLYDTQNRYLNEVKLIGEKEEVD